MPDTGKKKRQTATRRVLIEIPDDEQGHAIWKAVKLRATEQDKTMSAWVLEAIRDKLKKK
jgi:hypothetical protein